MPKILIDIPDELLAHLVRDDNGEGLESTLIERVWTGLDADGVAMAPPDIKAMAAAAIKARFSYMVEQIAMLPIGAQFSVDVLTEGEDLVPPMKTALRAELFRFAKSPESWGTIERAKPPESSRIFYRREASTCTQAK